MEIKVALNVQDPTYMSFEVWTDLIINENPDKADISVTPPELQWKFWAADLIKYNNLYPSPFYMDNWKRWALVVFELENP